jgi:molybdopterin-binding protein
MEELMTAREAAALLHLHPKRVQTLARAGRLPAVRSGRKWLFHRSQLMAALRRGAPRRELPEPAAAIVLSARNQLRGRISALAIDGMMAEVHIRIGDQELVSIITRGSAERLDLKEGDEVLAVIKSTEVMVAKSEW